MFKGLKIIKKNSYNKNINDSEIDVSKFSDDDVNDSIGLEALLKDDITDDDEDFNENGLSDDDEDISDEDDAINYNDLNFGINDNEIDSVYDKNDGLTTSLNKSLIVDNGDDNISNERNDGTKYQIIEEEKLCKKPLVNIQEINSNLLSKKQAKLDARTVFVGNIPIDTSIKTIEQLFKPFGEIENLRIRGVVPNDVKTSFKIATITKKKCPKLKSMYIFIVFKEEASAKLALKLNGHKLGNNTLRVDFSNSKNKYRDEKKSVFIGNLPFDITEDEVRAHFTSCGNIESVRIVRDRKSGISRGIGYVNFIEEDSVSLALELHDTLLKNCKLRVKTYCFKSKEIKRKHKKEHKQNNIKKKFKNNKCEIAAFKNSKNDERKKRSPKKLKGKKSIDNKNNISFHGQKSDVKKKFKKKIDMKRKFLAKKLTFIKELSNMTS